MVSDDDIFTINCCNCSAPNDTTNELLNNNKAFCKNCGRNLTSCDT